MKETKSERFNLHLTPTDEKIIKAKAKACNMNMTNYITASAIVEKIVVIGDEEGLKNVAYELNKIGTNINQIRMLVNLGKIDCINLEIFIEAFENLNSEVRRLINKKTKWQL
ncbi:MAG: plasmid mobilization protein [Eubacterium sp.]